MDVAAYAQCFTPKELEPAMSKNQERINRRHGQQNRRTRETLDSVLDNQAKTAEVLTNHEDRLGGAERAIKMLAARVTELERESTRR